MDSLVNDAINRLAEVPHYSMETFRDDLIEALCQLTQSSIAYFYATDLSEHYLTLLGYSKRVMESCAVNLKRPVDQSMIWVCGAMPSASGVGSSPVTTPTATRRTSLDCRMDMSR